MPRELSRHLTKCLHVERPSYGHFIPSINEKVVHERWLMGCTTTGGSQIEYALRYERKNCPGSRASFMQHQHLYAHHGNQTSQVGWAAY